MELRQLIYFRAAARTLSFTAAAKECYVAQASLSQQIKQLEKELGTQLFIRKNNVLILTDSGSILLQDAEKILHDVDEAMDHVSRAQMTQRFRLGFYGHPFGKYFPSLLAGFQKENPNIEIFLIEGTVETITEQLLQNRLDGIVSALDGTLHQNPLLKRELLWESGYTLIVPKGMYPPGKPITLKDKIPLPVITLSNTKQRQINQILAVDRMSQGDGSFDSSSDVSQGDGSFDSSETEGRSDGAAGTEAHSDRSSDTETRSEGSSDTETRLDRAPDTETRSEGSTDVGRRANTHHTVELLVASGQCAALLPELLAEGTDYVQVHPIKETSLRYQSYFICREDNHLPACRRFVDYTRDFLKKI